MSDITVKPEPQTDLLSRPLLTVLNLDWEKTIYIVFILAAFVTRFWDLGSRVMSHDESLHTQFSYQYFIGDGYNHTALMHGPFLFHLTAVSYWLFGDSDTSARIPVALFGIVLVLMPYLLRHWIGRIGALFASFFFLISPYITYYSRYIRHDIYVIMWALIVFFSIWYYLREPKEKYLWWFAAGTALMFSTKEVSFIYVAIFGSFLTVRLGSRILGTKWFHQTLPNLRPAISVLILALLMIGGSLAVDLFQGDGPQTAETTTATDEGFAADPNQDLTAVSETTTNNQAVLGWIQIVGLIVLGVGLFLAVREMRPHIDQYPEFDLIILFSTLLLITVSPLFTKLVGQNPMEYNIAPCTLAGQETMTSLQILLARIGQSECWRPIFTSSVIYSIGFLLFTAVAAILIGIWWHQRRWLTAAAIFFSIFTVLYTSVFTNPEGWASGAIGSLGYWLEQQEVARGNQPEFYYFFVVTFYEFLPLTFALLAIRHWLRQNRINQIVGYWLTLIIGSLLAYSLVNWWYNQQLLQIGQPTTSQLPGILAGLFLFGGGILYWFFGRANRILQNEGVANFSELTNREALYAFIPSVIWWFLLTWVAYSYAGEKMPWLSTHFVIPMAFLGGWYLNDKLSQVDWRALLSRDNLILLGLTLILISTAVVAAGPALLGTFQPGDQTAGNLAGIGRFLGSIVVVSGLLYLWLRQARIAIDDNLLILFGAILLIFASLIFAQDSTVVAAVVRWSLRLIALAAIFYSWRQRQEASNPLLNTNAILSLFILLALLTIRFTYMANFVNADYTTEYMVYAHGAPATKSIVLDQVEELSMRLHGDKTIRVAYDNDVSWPFTWYLRDYPNRHYFGDSPNNSINESPVLIVGRASWEKVEPYLGNNYESREYTFLWWPMEEYRKIASWNAIFGDPLQDAASRRGLGNPNVRQALWDIFFYRDYTKYGEVFGGNYSIGEWPLRHDLRLYIRKDVLANLWDYGLGAVAVEGLEDPYEEGELSLEPVMVLGGTQGTGEGQFTIPRNVTIAPDGRIYVADSGNHRIQVFDQEGNFLTAWGESGAQSGQFNEPWGLVADEDFLYVADTWNHRIQKFTLDGEWVNSFGISGSASDSDSGLGLFFGPRSLTLLPDNRLLVTDTGNHRMQVLDREGQFIAQIGSFGADLGALNEPVGLATGPDGSVYLADTWNGRIQRFSPELIAEHEWRVEAWTGQSINNKPYIAVDGQNRVYVTDPEGYRVLIFDREGNYLARFGMFGNDLRSFALPNGLAIDAQDNLYVADANNNRILKFAPVFGVTAEESPESDAEEGETTGEETNIEGETEEEESAGEPTDSAGESESDEDSESITPTEESQSEENDEQPTPTESE
jgi:predicted membrane-bound mannosyltransferase/DNA-binding beta-propeller fold protein YncE